MDTREKKKKINPCEKANIFSRLVFWWTWEMFRKGARNTLDLDDLYDPLKIDESERVGDTLEREWNIELEKMKNTEYALDSVGKKIKPPRPSLGKSIIRAFWLKYLYSGLWLILQCLILRTIQPLLQRQVIKYFGNGDASEIPTKDETLCYAAALVITTFGIALIVHHSSLDCQQIGMRVRVACCSLIYRKIFRESLTITSLQTLKIFITFMSLITIGTDIQSHEFSVIRIFFVSFFFYQFTIQRSLRLSKSALHQTAPGQIVNLLSNDVNRFDTVPILLHYVWLLPLQLTIVGFIIWQSVGISTFVGIGGILVLSVPVQSYLSNVSTKLRAKIARLTDRRVQLMSELIAGIQVVKMYAWEKPFELIVSRTRAREINVIKITSYLRGLYLGIMVFTERTTLFLTLVSFVLMGHTLTADVTFELATYFNILQLTCAIYFPQALILFGETRISIKRLEDFLLLDEIDNIDEGASSPDETTKPKNHDLKVKHPVTVEFQRVSANWISGTLPPTICDVSMKISSGKLCALVGPVGSGKSSLLNVLLRELPIGAGTVKLLQYNDAEIKEDQWKRGFIKDNPEFTISYASQEAWLFAGTVRENIVFGQTYDKNRYQEVVKVCALLRDFQQFPEGDSTIVGERGAALSGGQRARINLARAVYRQADLYLLDDPLSAVDTRVARQLFKNCILNYLRGKTRILVTHQLQFLKQAETIVMMERGAVKHQGSWEELVRTSSDFEESVNRVVEEKRESKRQMEGESTIVLADENMETPEATKSSVVETSLSFRRNATSSEMIVADNKFNSPDETKSCSSRPDILRRSSVQSQASSYYAGGEEENFSPGHGNTNEEAMATGRLSTRVYTSYFRAGGGIFILSLLALNMIVAQVTTSGADFWLSYWTNLEAVRTALHDPAKTISLKQYQTLVNDTMLAYFNILDEDGLLPTSYAIYIYTFCIVMCIVLTLLRSFLFMTICMKAGRAIHNRMFGSMLQAMMRFFNTNSSGRILNRFSKDVGAMDELLPKVLLEAVQMLLVLVGILVMIAVVNPWMVVPMIIMGITFYFTRIYYLNTAQDLKRLEGIAKSPVFYHISATLNGLTTIRSSGTNIQGILRKEFDRCQDTHSGAWFLYLAAASAFGLVLDIVSCLFVACVCYSFILINPGETFGGYVGLAISQSLILTGLLQYCIRQTTELQSQMTAVERILQYTDLPQEGPMKSANPPPETWPHRGRIEMKNVFMRYNLGDPPVLKDLNVVIEPSWKIGVVGRTGAGKSSLIGALFRLTGSGLEGVIKIDGIDTSSIGLHELRSCISIIPQEPVLFSESLRYNLDPFGKYSDSMLWDALREVELGDVSLEHKVAEGGTNFSVGQRQLICLARAILRNNRVLVLDEATANIDTRTDALIQKTIRSKFANCTVVTIAHRLNTIIDSDRVLVMDAGRIVEYGSPYELLFEKENGQFLEMIKQTGSTMMETLMEFVAKSHELNSSQNETSVL